MRKYFSLLASVIIISLAFNACKKNSDNPLDSTSNNDSTATTYFANSDGSSYEYSVVKTDSAQSQASGTRTSFYSGTSVVGSTTYQNEIDSLKLYGLTSVSTSLFQKKSDGIYYHIDTTGLYQVIPAQYKDYISIDPSIKILQTSFQDGTSWTAFSLGVKFGTTPINAVEVDAVYKGMEQVTLALTTGSVTVTAAKIQYTFILKANPLASYSSTFIANAWFADKIGIVKMDGNATILDTFTGNGINFSDTSSTVTQALIKYNIK